MCPDLITRDRTTGRLEKEPPRGSGRKRSHIYSHDVNYRDAWIWLVLKKLTHVNVHRVIKPHWQPIKAGFLTWVIEPTVTNVGDAGLTHHVRSKDQSCSVMPIGWTL